MAEVTQVKLSRGQHPALPQALPDGVIVYDIDGPLFFGAAQKAMGALGSITDHAKVVVLRMDAVPVMDVTGLVALESAVERLRANHCLTIISGLGSQPAALLAKSELGRLQQEVRICADTSSAMAAAEEYLRVQPSSLPAGAHA
jgi:SulP family sulfate permease